MSELRGAEKYRRPPEDDPRRKRLNAEVERANTVPIQTVLQDVFHLYVPSDLFRSWKTTCPFSYEHPDGGLEKNMRIYASNTAYCFGAHGVLTPVRMLQLQVNVSAVKAARMLSDRYGLARSEPYWKRMEKLVLEQATKRQQAGSPTYAVAALQTALGRVPGYRDREFDPVVTKAMEAELERLDEVLEARREGGVREWFRDALQRMTETVGERDGNP